MAKECEENSQCHKDNSLLYKMKISRIDLPPYNWLKTAKIYNKKYEQVSYEWLEHNADIIVAFFSAKNVNYKGYIEKFYETYENAKLVNLPIEVINIPMDETRKDFLESFEPQANWFTLKFNDDLIPLLMYMYGVTSLPHMIVLKTDGTIISSQGLLDFEEYGRNVLISWLSNSSSNKTHRRLSKEITYGPVWQYLTNDENRKSLYHKKFEVGEGSNSVPHIKDSDA